VLSGLLFSIFYSRMFSFVAYSLFGCLVNWWVIFLNFFFFRELISKRHKANSLKVSYVDFAEFSLYVVVVHLVP